MSETFSLILASSSRYRAELLSRLHLPFSIAAPHIDEAPLPVEDAYTTALRLSKAKALALAQTFPQSLIIGSDQVAWLDRPGHTPCAIGKPGNQSTALKQLQNMRGHTVVFQTGLCLYDGRTQKTQSTVIPTAVKFRNLSDETLENYLRAEQPYDCAGSAKSEGLGIFLLEHMRSDDPTALIGLPLIALTDMLLKAGITLPHGHPEQSI